MKDSPSSFTEATRIYHTIPHCTTPRHITAVIDILFLYIAIIQHQLTLIRPMITTRISMKITTHEDTSVRALALNFAPRAQGG